MLEREKKTKEVAKEEEKREERREEQKVPPSSPRNKKEKMESPAPSPKQKSVDLVPYIEEYLNMINIIGNLCVKAFKSK